MKLNGPVLLSAGGTGGHLFPAEALASELQARGHKVHLVTDVRAEKFAGHFPADAIHVVPSATIGSKNPLKILRAAWKILFGVRKAQKLIDKIKPAAVVGFGGYPTIPPLWVAAGAQIPTIIHEQNGVMGRANRLLAYRVDRIAGGFLKAGGAHVKKIVEVGNPARQSVLDVADIPYDTPTPNGDIRLLIFGGSQGARYFSDTMPYVFDLLPEALRKRLVITQQARPEDEARLKERFEQIGLRSEVASFFGDMPARMAGAHLVISRSGASTVNELSIIGRPAILVPLPNALDDDQGHNAKILVDVGGAVMRRQPQVTTENLANDLEELLLAPNRLALMAAGAKTAGKINASVLLADLVEAIATAV